MLLLLQLLLEWALIKMMLGLLYTTHSLKVLKDMFKSVEELGGISNWLIVFYTILIKIEKDTTSKF
jgi:hypothetical protein